MSDISKATQGGKTVTPRRLIAPLAACLAPLAWVAPVHAQDANTLLSTPVVPSGFDRGRNISVSERQRPDYAPLGVHLGTFLVYPRVDVGLGFDNNVYLSENDRASDAYAIISPRLNASSTWSRHAINLAASANLRRQFDETLNNQTAWRAAASGRLDVGVASSVTASAEAGRRYESPFSGEVDAAVAALSHYDYKSADLIGSYSAGRIRATLNYGYDDYSFASIELTDGTRLNQKSRDRMINAISGQLDYALTPSLSVFGQLSYQNIDYDRQVSPGVANRSSDGYRALGGVNLDLASFIRGTVGIGYTVRKYDSVRYDNVRGLSVEAKVEYFPSDLTTVTFGVRRVIEDSTFANIGAYWDSRASLRVDHELLRNLILNATGDYSRQKYTDTGRRNNVFRLGGGAQYLMSRTMGAAFNVGYSERKRDGTGLNSNLQDLRAEVTLTFQR